MVHPQERTIIHNEAYERGFIDGLRCFAWMKDGTTYVGTCGTTLSDAIAKLRELHAFNPMTLEEAQQLEEDRNAPPY